MLMFLFFLLLPVSFSQPLRGVFINCGANASSTINGLDWLSDTGYISAGTSHIITQQVLIPTLSNVRTFPLQNNIFKKFCYEIPVDRTSKYLIRTTYYYGGVNGNVNPPVFDQIVDGTLWSVVNTTEDYVNGNLSYYEGVFMPTGKNLSVCLAANTYTDSDPFISAIEIVLLWDQLYNSTDFRAYGLSLVARHSFGHDGPVIGYPDDQFNRYWEPFGLDAFPQPSSQNLAVSGIWNLPPPIIFQTRLARSLVEPLTLLWPPFPLPSSELYYIALYFADDRDSSSRTMDITINGVPYYRNLTVTAAGNVVFANQWPLGGITNLTLTPAPGSTVVPLINVIAMISLRGSFQNPPADWNGDPCLPSRYSWTGVTCSDGPRIRIVTLNLMSMGLSGSISPSIARLTALTSILLGNNSLSGSIPDLSSLRGLQSL
ncbi:leucine-rich repeat receptor-like serine/threonine-protein kinase at2g14510 [Phtheirospermum japonicum]|uniref:Leucine-rich repeat receptor-like serine/threonine-protein kinase at2g14510 n=1 Tax=Phtheirospermum japonicum TaxID=374723 RepID=A0A830B9Y6_9LAMI|nr:leucine-rich repeat receptor-like serine/threonine-protein kinase at2g14510 [Phtheirospermum japonicum]